MLTFLAISFGLNSTIFSTNDEAADTFRTRTHSDHGLYDAYRSYEDPYQELAQILFLTSSHVLPVSPAPAVI